MALDMGWLIVARGVQGVGGGLVLGGGMALISAFYDAGLRTRILAVYQGVWMVAQLLGPVHGGAFAELEWWRGAFWAVMPFIVVFIGLAWFTLPERLDGDGGGGGRFPLLRLGLLASGVLAIASVGLIAGPGGRLGLIIAAPALVWLTFHLDGRAPRRIFPTDTVSPRKPVGVALWIIFLIGVSQNSVLLFLPLLLLVVHGVTPLFISFVSIIITTAWTIGTVAVSGWSGARERFALGFGPLLTLGALAVLAGTAELPLLWLLALAAFVLGFGIGIHNVHLVSRTMAHARAGEERITSSSVASIRSLGTATGAAMAGMLANIAGLGDATNPDLVGSAIGFVWAVNLVPLAIAALFMFRLVRFAPGR
jgi:predicted MFS family arabinose efflux permease